MSTSSPAGRTGSPRTRSSSRTCRRSGSTRARSSSRTTTRGTRTLPAQRTRRCSGRSADRAPRSASSTPTSPTTPTSRPDRMRRPPETGSTSRATRAPHCSSSGSRRSTRRSSWRQRLSSRSCGCSSCRSFRCSSGPAGRPTAPSTSIASTRRRITSAIRSSPPSRTTSLHSRASAPAARPEPEDHRRSRRAGFSRPPRYSPGVTCAGS